MKKRTAWMMGALLCAGMALADTFYVSTNSVSNGPGTAWSNAFHTIQQGVDAVAAGDTVLVTNGVYDAGGATALSYQLTNRVCVTKEITVESVNGPEFTFIVGASENGTNGPAAVRGVFMNAGMLSGFTVTNGHTLISSTASHDRRGGGIMCYSGSPVISNCVISGNTSDVGGGGILLAGGTPMVDRCEIRGNECLGSGSDGGGLLFYSGDGTLRNCLFAGNTAADGGGGLYIKSGAVGAQLENCTIADNMGVHGGGVYVYDGHLLNCIIYGNTATAGGDNWGAGTGTASFEYTCITPTNSLPGGTGCIEDDPLFAGGGSYRLQSGSPCIDSGTNQSWMAGAMGLGGHPRICEGTVDMGAYEFGAGKDSGDSPIHYVSPSGGHIWPYASWATAATDIQTAVETAADGDTVLVTNGVYDVGGATALNYALTNRVSITNDITVESVNGPESTMIAGAADGGGNGPAAVRGVFMSAGMLSGFTVTNGYTLLASTSSHDRRGGGIMCYEGSTVISNCVISGNTSDVGGGGILLAGGTLAVERCEIRNNQCTASGADGGGVLVYSGSGTFTGCILAGNDAEDRGGGAYHGTLNNCLLEGNSAYRGGGGYGCSLHNCTISGNYAEDRGGGVNGGTLRNCIIYGNTNNNPFYSQTFNYENVNIAYCCTSPDPGGTANITDDPEFMDAAADNYRILLSSPCNNAGNNADAPGSVDLDGGPRIVDGIVDIGAYEDSVSVSITNPASDVVVSNTVSSMVLAGIATQSVTGYMSWSNAATASQNSFVAATNWSVPDLPLTYGDNLITVYGSNSTGIVVSDSVTIRRDPLDSGDSPIHYVSSAGANIWPYTNWLHAATNLQDAIDTADHGDTVLVADGVYDTGSRATPRHQCLNRIVIVRDTLVKSVLGPDHAFIVGAEAPGGGIGVGAVRGVYMSAGTLSGFTITNGYTIASGTDDYNYDYDQNGGGVNLYGGNGTVSNCVVEGNAGHGGGGCYGGTVTHCTIRNNTAFYGGGSAEGTLMNCLITDNYAETYGGGTGASTLTFCTVYGNVAGDTDGGCSDGSLHNCIVFNNTASIDGDNIGGCVASYCCTVPNPGGTGNITNSPLFADASHGDFHPLSRIGRWDPGTGSWVTDGVHSPCIDTGDPDAEFSNEPAPSGSRANMGVYGNTSEASKGGPDVIITNPPASTTVGGTVTAFTITGTIYDESASRWLQWTNALTAEHGEWEVTGGEWQLDVELGLGDNIFTVLATNALGMIGRDCVTISRTVHPEGETPVHYASPQGSNIWPYTNWVTAATSLQDAILTADAGDRVLATNGVYSTGSSATPGYGLRNRVCITADITVESVNGPTNTLIVGVGPNGGAAIRGAYLSAGVLSGFTITNGHTWATGGTLQYDCAGGGLWQGTDSVVSNCTIINNGASTGGGVFIKGGGLLVDSLITSNSTPGEGGGIRCEGGGVISGCEISHNEASSGGGIDQGSLTNCTITGNTADNNGGGLLYASATDCTLSGNHAEDGGGSYGGTLQRCKVADNWGNYGGGAEHGTLEHCIVTGNRGWLGGGANSANVRSSLIADNQVNGHGGGCSDCDLLNCTVVGNAATTKGGGVESGSLTNCIVYGNTADDSDPNWIDVGSVSYSCTTPDPGGTGNTTAPPQFVDAPVGNYRLQPASPCIDAGTNMPEVVSDLDGVLLPLDGDADGTNTIDMGCYEYLNRAADSDGDTMTDGFEVDYGLDPTTDDADGNPDGDPFNNGEEFIADTDPTNTASYFHIVATSNLPPFTVYFDSSSNRLYTLYGNTNLVEGSWSEVTNRMGAGGLDSMSGTNNVPVEFYKLEVSTPE